MERKVECAIKDALKRLNAVIGFCSLGSGSDILFAEKMLERDGAELHVVLPFDLDDFRLTSVDYGLASMSRGGALRGVA